MVSCLSWLCASINVIKLKLPVPSNVKKYGLKVLTTEVFGKDILVMVSSNHCINWWGLCMWSARYNGTVVDNTVQHTNCYGNETSYTLLIWGRWFRQWHRKFQLSSSFWVTVMAWKFTFFHLNIRKHIVIMLVVWNFVWHNTTILHINIVFRHYIYDITILEFKTFV